MSAPGLSVIRAAIVLALMVPSAGWRAALPQAPKAPAPAPAAPTATALPADYVIGVEDVLGVLFWRDQEISGDVTVRPDGMITLRLIGDIQAAGLKPDALAGEIAKAATRFIEDPSVTVVVRQINSRRVFITGEVKAPGAYPLLAPTTVMQLIALAGGLTEFADKSHISILRVEQGRTLSFRFNYNDVAKGRKLAQNIALKKGDTVVVP
jgi:polysaccharide export outer membrane protein